MSLEDSMKRVQLETENNSIRLMAAQLRKFLSTALCAHCGEALGTDDEIVQSDDETKTLHAECAEEVNP